MTASIKVTLANLITRQQVLLVIGYTPRQATRYGPQASCIKCPMQSGVRHQPRDTAIPVGKRMNEEQSMMCRSGG